MDHELSDGGCRDLLAGQQTAYTFSLDCANIRPLIWINVDPYRPFESASWKSMPRFLISTADRKIAVRLYLYLSQIRTRTLIVPRII